MRDQIRVCVRQHQLTADTRPVLARLSETVNTTDAPIDIWTFSLDTPSAPLQELQRYLSPNEIARRDRYATTLLADRFTAARGQLRLVLGALTGTAPGDLVFATGSFGKPRIAAAQGTEQLEFNFSDSAGFGMLAVSRTYTLGVDIEAMRPLDDASSLARRCFSDAEYRALMNLPDSDRHAGFYACWTRKEAIMKADGRGMSLSLDRFTVSVAPDEPARLLSFQDPAAQAEDFTLEDLKAPSGFKAALAVLGVQGRKAAEIHS